MILISASLQRLFMWMLVHQTMGHKKQVDLEEVFVGVQDKSGTKFLMSYSSFKPEFLPSQSSLPHI
jgi:hypothetical protein